MGQSGQLKYSTRLDHFSHTTTYGRDTPVQSIIAGPAAFKLRNSSSRAPAGPVGLAPSLQFAIRLSPHQSPLQPSSRPTERDSGTLIERESAGEAWARKNKLGEVSELCVVCEEFQLPKLFFRGRAALFSREFRRLANQCGGAAAAAGEHARWL